jgi:hypothetical protein
MELRDYQKDWIDRIYKSWDAGNRYIIAQLEQKESPAVPQGYSRCVSAVGGIRVR